MQAAAHSLADGSILKHTQLPGSFASLPIQLKCVMASKNSRGKVTYIPYQNWEHSYEASNVEPPQNQPRYYYLESPLSRGEWRILSDMVKVYPYISSKQTNKFLSAISRMAPGIRTDRADNRYAFKHKENEKFFLNIELLDSAISARKPVTIRYGNYVLEEKDGEWLPALRLPRPVSRHVSRRSHPHQAALQNGNGQRAAGLLRPAGKV